MKEIASIQQLSVCFQTTERQFTAVDDVSFCLTPGETLALVGESGCGKSLTSLAIMRLLPNNALYGQKSIVSVLDDDLLCLPEYLMRSLRGRQLAMIFQDPMTALNPVLSIGQQLAEALQAHQTLTRADVHTRMLTLLNDVEMTEPERRLQQYPHQLSGGQKQRIVIAMALASHPDILIADEPTTALDVTIQMQIITLLKKLQRQYQMSILLITHDLGVVKAMADKVCVMYAGQIVESAMVKDFFIKPRHPYAQQLFVSLPSFSKRGERLQTLVGSVPTPDDMPKGCRFHPRCQHVLSVCDQVEPALQTLQPAHSVRCHWYPDQSELPPLSLSSQTWGKRDVLYDVVLSAEELSIHFYQRRGLFRGQHDVHKAVDGLSFQLKEGKTLALVGESGCGKTTTSRALLRLQSITAGKVLFRGVDTATLRGYELRHFRKKVQIIFQDPYSSMNPRMTVDDILSEGLHAQGMNACDIRSKQYEVLDQVHLSRTSLHRYPHQFSGGQRQRICIARALAMDPEVLICDEPTSALDMSVQAQILNLLKSLQYDLGLSYLLITHNMSVVSYLADDVLVMRAGQAVESGEAEQILTKPCHEYTKQLLASVLLF
jgi:peptide/nickel transport system ATP-binding protein